MFKKLLKGVFVLTAVLMLNSPAHAFYSDMDENHWAYQSIKFLTEVGVVVGYPDGTYKPDIPVTRAEFASMAIKALGQEDASVTQDIHFSDVKPDFWAYDIIKKAVYRFISFQKLFSIFNKHYDFPPEIFSSILSK